MDKQKILAIVGPTASGKTKVAVDLAFQLQTEIISGDSRQVYRGMDLGTGKDLDEYFVNGVQIPYHLIDIVEAGYKYNIYEYQNDFFEAYKIISQQNKLPILCGGSGLYVQSVLQNYNLLSVPPNSQLQQKLEDKSLEELSQILKTYKTVHNRSDTETQRRAIRAIEIADYQKTHTKESVALPRLSALIIGVDISREARREKISRRLKTRLEEGMIQEVEKLLKTVSPEVLIYYGLEYKYISLHLIGELSYADMVSQLEIAIHQFAKRQMTWYRGMERKGIKIHWLDSRWSSEQKNEYILDLINQPDNFIQN